MPKRRQAKAKRKSVPRPMVRGRRQPTAAIQPTLSLMAWPKPSADRKNARESRYRGIPSNPRMNRSVTRVAPVAINSRKTTWHRTSTRMEGKSQITIITGCSPIAYIRYQSATLTPPGALQEINASSGEASVIALHPTTMFLANSDLAYETLTHTKFRFTKFKVSLDTRATTGTFGSFLFGYYPDADILGADVTSNLVLALPGTASVAVWAAGPIADYTSQLDTSSWLYIDDATSSDAARRQAYQGKIIGVWDSIPAAATWGYIFADFTIELRQPRPYNNFASMILRRELGRLGIPHPMIRAGLQGMARRDMDREFKQPMGVLQPFIPQPVLAVNDSKNPVPINISAVSSDGVPTDIKGFVPVNVAQIDSKDLDGPSFPVDIKSSVDLDVNVDNQVDVNIAAAGAGVVLPVSLPDDYDLDVTVTGVSGTLPINLIEVKGDDVDSRPVPCNITQSLGFPVDEVPLSIANDLDHPLYVQGPAGGPLPIVGVSGGLAVPIVADSDLPVVNSVSGPLGIQGGGGIPVDVSVVAQLVNDDYQYNQPFIIQGQEGAVPVPVDDSPFQVSGARKPAEMPAILKTKLGQKADAKSRK